MVGSHKIRSDSLSNLFTWVFEISIDTSTFYLGYFKIGKVNKSKENSINITLFHFELDIKTEQVMQEDVLLNFDNVVSKSIFELDDKRQKILMEKVMELRKCLYY
jgi:hypothetical protein